VIAFVARMTPRSVNARSVGRYRDRLRQEFGRQAFDGVPLAGALYARVYYFCAGRLSIDADNLSKPVLDALIGCAYGDDSAVVFRARATIEARSMGLKELDVNDVPDGALTDLVDALGQGVDALYIEVGTFHPSIVAFGSRTDGT
jgi:hypothetical protein